MDDKWFDLELRKSYKCRVFLGCTGSVMHSGVRDSIRYLCEHKMVDMIVTTADGVEADLIRCLGEIYVDELGGFEKFESHKGMKRRGNVYIPHQSYHNLQKWFIKQLPEIIKI